MWGYDMRTMSQGSVGPSGRQGWQPSQFGHGGDVACREGVLAVCGRNVSDGLPEEAYLAHRRAGPAQRVGFQPHGQRLPENREQWFEYDVQGGHRDRPQGRGKRLPEHYRCVSAVAVPCSSHRSVLSLAGHFSATGPEATPWYVSTEHPLHDCRNGRLSRIITHAYGGVGLSKTPVDAPCRLWLAKVRVSTKYVGLLLQTHVALPVHRQRSLAVENWTASVQDDDRSIGTWPCDDKWLARRCSAIRR